MMNINDFIEKHLNEKTGYVELLPVELIAVYESGNLTKEHSNDKLIQFLKALEAVFEDVPDKETINEQPINPKRSPNKPQ